MIKLDIMDKLTMKLLGHKYYVYIPEEGPQEVEPEWDGSELSIINRIRKLRGEKLEHDKPPLDWEVNPSQNGINNAVAQENNIPVEESSENECIQMHPRWDFFFSQIDCESSFCNSMQSLLRTLNR